MNSLDPIQIGRDLMYYGLLLAMPSLLLSLVVGLLISVFQATTSIQEQTLSFVPRLLAVLGLLLLTMPWIMQVAVYFTTMMFTRAAQVGL